MPVDAADKVTYVPCPQCLKLNKISFARAREARPKCGACGAEIVVQGAVMNVDARQLRKLIAASPLPVIVDFWAPWCAPCRAFAPTFEEVAHEKEGGAVFVKVNTEAEPQASVEFSVRGIPTLTVFKNGREVGRQAGALPSDYFRTWIDQTAGASAR